MNLRPTKLPKQNDLKKVCKGVFDAGADTVRLEVDGMIIIATKKTVDDVIANPLDSWMRKNG